LGYTLPIFTKFFTVGMYLIVDYNISDRLRGVAMATAFSVKIGEMDLFIFIRRPVIRKQIAVSHF